MDDIVEQLRRTKFMQHADIEILCDQAAAEIERLRHELLDYQRTLRALEEEINTLVQAQSGWGRVPRLEAEVARLRSVLESWGISNE